MKVLLNESVKETPNRTEMMQSRELKPKSQNDRTFGQLKRNWEKFKLIQLKC